MASINYSGVVILFFLVFQYSSASNVNDYEKWLSWNKDHYLTMKANATFTESAIGKEVLDDRLMFAEANKLTIRVNQMGTGDFKTIKEALATVPPHNDKRVEINIGPGVYREKIHIPSTMGFITFLGDASNPPTITGSDWSGANPGGTFDTATVGVDGDYFIASNIKFENTHPHETGSDKDQAVALRISGTKAAFFNCGFYGSQDTLYDHKGLHYFSNCFIQGSVDFICGDGRSFYENCELKSIAKTSGAVTAQQRESPSLDSGFSFKNCRITGSGQIYLGRAWGAYSRVVFSYTAMDNIILPEGWNDWGVPNRDSTVYYGEYNCNGVGANMSGRVKWARRLTDQEAQPFLGTYFVDGDTWITKP